MKNNITFNCEPVDTNSQSPTFVCLGDNKMDLNKSIENFENSNNQDNAVDYQPVTYLPLLSDAKDLGLNPQKSVIQGQTTFITQNGSLCAYFNNRMDTYVQVDNTTETSFTVAFWFNLRDGNNYTIVSRTDGGNPSLQFDTASGDVLHIYTALPNQWHANNTNSRFASNTWYHAAYVVDGINTTIYINGEVDNKMTGAGLMPSKPLWFIGRSGDSGRAANVCIRQFATWKIAIDKGTIQKFMTESRPDAIVSVKVPKLECKDYQVQFGNFCVPKWLVGEKTLITSSSSFDPKKINGLQFWVDGMDPLNNGSAPSNDTVITTWSDKSGNGNDATGGNSPKFNNNSIVFDGGSNFLQTPITANPVNETIFIVFTLANNAGGGNNDMWASSLNHGRGFQVIGNPARLKYDVWGVSGFADAPENSIVRGKMSIGTGTYEGGPDNGTAIVYVNGGQFKGGPQKFSTDGGGKTRIGCGAGGDYFNGSINEIVYYNRVLNDTDRQKVEGYLAWKWGIQSNLPSNHNYNTSKP